MSGQREVPLADAAADDDDDGKCSKSTAKYYLFTSLKSAATEIRCHVGIYRVVSIGRVINLKYN